MSDYYYYYYQLFEGFKQQLYWIIHISEWITCQPYHLLIKMTLELEEVSCSHIHKFSLRQSAYMISRPYKGRKLCDDVFLYFGWLIWCLSCFCASVPVLQASSTNSMTEICKIGFREDCRAYRRSSQPSRYMEDYTVLVASCVSLGWQLFSAYSRFWQLL